MPVLSPLVSHVLQAGTRVLAARSIAEAAKECGDAAKLGQDDGAFGDLVVTRKKEGANPSFTAAPAPALPGREQSLTLLTQSACLSSDRIQD